jgi:hypothetical protein
VKSIVEGPRLAELGTSVMPLRRVFGQPAGVASIGGGGLLPMGSRAVHRPPKSNVLEGWGMSSPKGHVSQGIGSISYSMDGAGVALWLRCAGQLLHFG